jgi:hypothetical protein
MLEPVAMGSFYDEARVVRVSRTATGLLDPGSIQAGLIVSHDTLEAPDQFRERGGQETPDDLYIQPLTNMVESLKACQCSIQINEFGQRSLRVQTRPSVLLNMVTNEIHRSHNDFLDERHNHLTCQCSPLVVH